MGEHNKFCLYPWELWMLHLKHLLLAPQFLKKNSENAGASENVLRESPRDYLSDTPLGCALWGFWCLNMANWVRYPLPFSERFPHEEHAKWSCDTPPLKRGISAILARHPMKTRQIGCDTPLRYYLERVLRDMGGISHWAAKCRGK